MKNNKIPTIKLPFPNIQQNINQATSNPSIS
jgi:hypothetical protein